MKRFVLVGAAGYIAPRHFAAIKATKNLLVAAMDVSDSVGVLDSFFPECRFFTKYEELHEFIIDQTHSGGAIDFMVICTPNNLHVTHINTALQMGLDVICEKPLVLTNKELEKINNYQRLYGGKVNSILQLRLHPKIIDLKRKITGAKGKSKYDVDLTYITSRGRWYDMSWKGDEKKSGGVVSNIGVHFFDMLGFVFGEFIRVEVHLKEEKVVAGFIELAHARVRWFLSTEERFLPENAVKGEKLTFRSITVDGTEIEFSGGFTDLHELSYEAILGGEGFTVDDNKDAIDLVERIRFSEPISDFVWEEAHPLVRNQRQTNEQV